MKIYSVIDRKAKLVVCSFTSVNDEMAKRSFEMMLTDVEEDVFTLHPEDFSLVLSFEVEEDVLFKLDSVIDGASYSRAYLTKEREDRAAFLHYLNTLKDSNPSYVSRENSVLKET